MRRLSAGNAARIRRGIWAARACEWVGVGLAAHLVYGDRLADRAFTRYFLTYAKRKQERLGWEV